MASMLTGMADEYPSRTAEKIVVRLPDGMRDHLAEMAKSNRRSVNAEVVDALHAWISARERRAQGLGQAMQPAESDARVLQKIGTVMMQLIESDPGLQDKVVQFMVREATQSEKS